MRHDFLRLAFAAVLIGLLAACRTEAAPRAAVGVAASEEIGSLRNARVAHAAATAAAPLTFFAGELSDDERAELAELAPHVRVVAGLSRDEALARATEAHAIDARFATAEFLERAPNLVWVQAMSAGVERYLALERIASDERLVLSNLRGVTGPAIADHAFAMLLFLTRGLHAHVENQERGLWQRDAAKTRPIALRGKTMLVVGLGGIGLEVAQRAHGCGMRVIATRRSDAAAPGYVERVGTPDELLALLPEAYVVAICTPLTPETEGMFDAAAFAALKHGAYLVNVARGKIVDTDALLAALDAGRLAGACLDVTEPEPLPAEHPLWSRPNVVITPHVSSDAEITDERRWSLVKENVRRFGAGEPLLNVVDKRAGY